MVPNFNTVGASAVPPKSPANLILPFAVVVASGIAFCIVDASLTTFLTKAVVATAVLLSVEVIVPAVTLLPKVTEPVKVGDAIGAFKANAATVALEITLSKSAVFSTFDNPKLALALVALTAPVPPFTIATIPLTFVAVPLNVPANNVEVTLLAVISPAPKLPVPSLATTVLGTLLLEVFKN